MYCFSHSVQELERTTWVPSATVAKLWLYPVKSCAPLELLEAIAGTRGLVDPVSGIRDRYIKRKCILRKSKCKSSKK